VNAELLELNMKGVTFHAHIEKLTELSATGLSDVEFLSQTSAKDVKRPLAKFASGGELSRILLSLKRVVGSSNQPRTYLFDEVDTGVSGETAEKVGRKLKTIAKGQQVICVTHLPQVAAFGDTHFFIQKSPNKDSVAMLVSELKQKDRVQEIARLISGEKISKTSLAHAEQLLTEAK
ncbi:MAG: DNA repair protein RecN, partial [Bdellovibrio sp.]|nr:DNA repair protein RecN [Bdellovibrio sp.]